MSITGGGETYGENDGGSPLNELRRRFSPSGANQHSEKHRSAAFIGQTSALDSLDYPAPIPFVNFFRTQDVHASVRGLCSSSSGRILRPHRTQMPNLPAFIRSSAARIRITAFVDLQSSIRDCRIAAKIESGVATGCPMALRILSSVKTSDSVWRKSR